MAPSRETEFQRHSQLGRDRQGRQRKILEAGASSLVCFYNVMQRYLERTPANGHSTFFSTPLKSSVRVALHPVYSSEGRYAWSGDRDKAGRPVRIHSMPFSPFPQGSGDADSSVGKFTFKGAAEG